MIWQGVQLMIKHLLIHKKIWSDHSQITHLDELDVMIIWFWHWRGLEVNQIYSHTSRKQTETIRRALHRMEGSTRFEEEEARQDSTSGTFFRKDLLEGIQRRANGEYLVKPNTGIMHDFKKMQTCPTLIIVEIWASPEYKIRCYTWKLTLN